MTSAKWPLSEAGPETPPTARPEERRATRFLRPPDVAEIMSVTVALVYSLMRSGELPAIKIGKQGLWRVSRVALDAYLDDLEREAYERARNGKASTAPEGRVMPGRGSVGERQNPGDMAVARDRSGACLHRIPRCGRIANPSEQLSGD